MSKIENDCQIDDVIDFVYHAKDVDIQEMLEHFRKYLKIRPYLNIE